MFRTLISPLLQGHIDLFQPLEDGQAQLRGWIFREDTAINRVDIRLHGKAWMEGIQLGNRPDVKDAYEPLIGSRPHLSRSGFDVTALLPEGFETAANTIIEITPYTPTGRRLDPLLTHFCPFNDEVKASPMPPVALQERVGGSSDFIQIGAHAATSIMTYVSKYKPDFLRAKILDWGCGCGRVIAQILRFVPATQLHGCDIDAAAIEWNQQNIPGPEFTRVAPYPPTPYPDDVFDVVYGISVMTHLSEETQKLWLKELKRITRSGAILALSVIGEQLRATNMPASLADDFTKNGFASFVPYYSDMLSEFSHQGYYQEAYHTLDYILRNWTSYFEVLEYVESKHQDIVILRKM
jgi:SAM-dependent methyltransferase